MEKQRARLRRGCRRLFLHYQQTQHAFGVDDAKILILFLVLFSEWDAPAKHYWLILA